MNANFLPAVVVAATVTACNADNIEVGEVDWGRDLDAAYTASENSGKPVLVLFQEVPGCAGCQRFGKEVLSHPQIVEAIETEFEPVLVYNNHKEDAEILKRFGEPVWNYQVVRFLNAEGKDIVPRKDKVWTIGALAGRMAEALESRGRTVPGYLKALAALSLGANTDTVAFAMHCFWTGEMRLGSIEGVLTTEAGFLENREVTKVVFDREKVSFSDLVAIAASYDCANKVYTTNSSDAETARNSRLVVGTLTDGYPSPGR